MQKFAAAQIHKGFLQVFQVLVRHMVLVPCLAVDGSLHEGLLGHIQFSQTVDYDMDMNVSAAIVPVHVRTDQLQQCSFYQAIAFLFFQIYNSDKPIRFIDFVGRFSHGKRSY